MKAKSRFESIGVKIPAKRLSTKELTSMLKFLGKTKLERFTGIKERRVCSPGEDSYTLATEAALDCLNYSRYKGQQLEMIVSCSISRYKDGLTYIYEPPLSLYIKDAIGAVNALNFDISNACAGMLTGVYIVDDFIKRGVVRNGMVVSGEYITSLSDNAVKSIRTAASRQLASLTLGDAGAAVILEKAPQDETRGLHVSPFTTFSRFNDLCIARQSRKSPGAYMLTRTRKIHQAAITCSPPLLKEALRENGLSFDQVDYVIPHQTSRSAIYSGTRRFVEYLGAKPGRVLVNLENYSNTASTSHFLALYRYLEEGRFRQGDRVMLVAFASGLVVGVVVFCMDDMVTRYGNKN